DHPPSARAQDDLALAGPRRQTRAPFDQAHSSSRLFQAVGPTPGPPGIGGISGGLSGGMPIGSPGVGTGSGVGEGTPGGRSGSGVSGGMGGRAGAGLGSSGVGCGLFGSDIGRSMASP